MSPREARAFDPRRFRALFPALERYVWLNTATVAPGARPVLDALRRVEREWEEGTFDWQAWEAEAHATRPLFARMIGAEPSSVALVHSVSEAAGTVARSLPSSKNPRGRSGGRVVVGAREFRSNLFPWLQLRERGFDVVEVPATDGVVRTEALVDAIDPRTVLVAVTEVQSLNGFRVRLGEIARRAREVGARLFVSVMQSLGALRFDVREHEPDFVVTHGYKWLLGPRGAAWVYVRPDRLDETAPLAANWKSVADPYAEYYGGPMVLAPDARRLDTSLAWFPWVGAKAALELLLSYDPAAIEARCLGLARAFREEASALGFALVPEEAPSHIVGVRVPDPEGLRRRLAARNVIAAVRGGFLRIGFHAFNDESDLAAALAALGSP